MQPLEYKIQLKTFGTTVLFVYLAAMHYFALTEIINHIAKGMQ